MLLLSRQLGEAIVIDNHVIATLAVLANDFVEFSLSDINGANSSSIVTVGKKELTAIVAGVRAVFVRKDAHKARLGFEYPPEIRIDRREFWVAPPR